MAFTQLMDQFFYPPPVVWCLGSVAVQGVFLAKRPPTSWGLRWPLCVLLLEISELHGVVRPEDGLPSSPRSAL